MVDPDWARPTRKAVSPDTEPQGERHPFGFAEVSFNIRSLRLEPFEWYRSGPSAKRSSIARTATFVGDLAALVTGAMCVISSALLLREGATKITSCFFVCLGIIVLLSRSRNY